MRYLSFIKKVHTVHFRALSIALLSAESTRLNPIQIPPSAFGEVSVASIFTAST